MQELIHSIFAVNFVNVCVMQADLEIGGEHVTSCADRVSSEQLRDALNLIRPDK